MKTTALLLVLLATFAISLSAQEGGMGTLAGTVLNSQGKPVAGVSVTMETANGGSPHATVTNAQGRFFFPQLLHGYYDVRAAQGGMASDWKHNIEVITGKQTSVILRLTRAKRKSE